MEFTTYVEARADALFRAAWLLTHDRADAADLVQETLVGLYPKWEKVVGADLPDAYVRRAMVNRYLSQARKSSAGEVVSADLPDSPAPDRGFEIALDRALLERPLADLSPAQRAAVTLRYYEGLSDAEAADAMGCPVATLRSHLRRGLAALRRQLAPTDAPGRLS